MSLFLQQEDSDFRLGIWKMDETYEELCALLPGGLVGEAEQRFPAFHRRQEWLSVRALLARMAGSGHEIAYLPSGKPYLQDSHFHISISHTKGYVSIILSANPVGIDIEQYGPRVHKVSSRFMREDEKALPWLGDDTWSLLLHWSAKEVLYKCLDTESVDFQKHLRIFPFTPQPQGTFHACEYKSALQRTFQIHYRLHPDFVLTWALA